jgi:hypothetical protein
LHENSVAGHKIVQAMADRYPHITCNFNCSYERPRLLLQVLGTKDSQERNDIREWLTQFKADRLSEFEVWLRFDDLNVIDESDASALSKKL